MVWDEGAGSQGRIEVCITLVYTDAHTLTYTQRAKLQTRRTGTLRRGQLNRA